MPKMNHTVALCYDILEHMEAVARGQQHSNVLLAGDPGVGKTTFVRLFGALTGIRTVVIEIPHVTEEHLINIPFIVYKPETNSTQVVNDRIEDEYDLVLAQSHLYNQIVSPVKLSDEQYLNDHLQNKVSPYIQQLYKQLGGTATKMPANIKAAREKFKVILFLDEFYRQTSPRIRNILRGILNKRIGMHEIPDHAYIVYASNLKDTGIEKIPLHQQVHQIDFPNPRKDDWFDWLVSTFQNHQQVRLNPQVIDKFKKALKDEDLSFEDDSTRIRTSPRRWEQILLYINSSIPVSNFEEAQALLTNVKNSFVDYKSGEYSALAKKVVKATAELIKETSGEKVDENDVLDADQWRSNLDHLIQAQMKLGESRRHVPIIAGPPGIGKTTEAMKVAKKHNLRLIDIDVSRFNAEDVGGMPIPGNVRDKQGQVKDKKNIRVKFSLPALYEMIMRQIREADAAYFEELRSQHGANAEKYIEKYKQQKYKYLIFFDELNAVDDEKTFNAIRRVLLDKSFGPKEQKEDEADSKEDELKLPKDAIVIGALNPHRDDVRDLTHHLKDVIDVIPAEANWAGTRKYIQEKAAHEDYSNVPQNVKQVALNLVDAFVDNFKSKDEKHKPRVRPFFIDVGTEVYVSPREYVDLFAILCRKLNRIVRMMMSDPDLKEGELREAIDDAAYDAFREALSFVMTKHQVQADEFFARLRNWIEGLDGSLFGGMVTKKFQHATNLANVLAKYFDGGREVVDMPEDVQILNQINSLNNAQIVDNFRELMETKFTDEAAWKKFAGDESEEKIDLQGDKLVYTSGAASHLTNVMLALFYTLHMHKASNDRLVALARALSQATSAVGEAQFKAGKISEDAVYGYVREGGANARSAVINLMKKFKET